MLEEQFKEKLNILIDQKKLVELLNLNNHDADNINKIPLLSKSSFNSK